MQDSEIRQAAVDEEHLRLLAIGYIVSGAMSALFSLIGLFYAGMGVLLATLGAASAGQPARGEPPPALFGVLFGIVGGVIFLWMVTLAVLKFRTAACLRRRQGRVFCQVVAALSCFGIPYGTLLGVATFLVLGRPQVAARFNAPAANPPAR
jgi:hypothetical protein